MYEYPGKRACRELLERGLREALATGHDWHFTLTNVDERVFRTAFIDSNDGLFSHWKEYDHRTRVLTVIMPTGAHTSIAASMVGEILLKLLPMGLSSDQFCPTGPKTFTLEMPDGATVTKEPDQSWIPINPTRQDGPTAVLEVKYSETASKLQSDVHKWLSARNQNVKFAMTVSITRKRRNLTFQSWQLKGGGVQSKQTITVERYPKRPVKISGSPSFKIQFKSLLDREPEGNEGDIIFTRDDLKKIAQNLWQATDHEVPGLKDQMAHSRSG